MGAKERMQIRIYSSDTNVQLEKKRVNFIEPKQLYKTIDLIKRKHKNYQFANLNPDKPKKYLLPTGIVELFSEDTEDIFPEIQVSSRTKEGLKRLVNSLSLPLGHAPKE